MLGEFWAGVILLVKAFIPLSPKVYVSQLSQMPKPLYDQLSFATDIKANIDAEALYPATEFHRHSLRVSSISYSSGVNILSNTLNIQIDTFPDYLSQNVHKKY